MIEFIYLFFGLFLALIIDIIWWVKPSLSKSDRFKAHEHYHVALELVILFILIDHITNSPALLFILGAALGFLLGEWDQLKEIKNHKVIPGHPFAFGSDHFKTSCIIGIILTSIAITLYLI